jgi:hypothetical protein
MTASVVMKWSMPKSPGKVQEMVPEQRWDCRIHCADFPQYGSICRRVGISLLDRCPLFRLRV